MDVQCERCKTDYLFDDALVSERGTMVRCTTCGHQFRVRAGADADTQPITDRWLVHTGAGQRLTFSSLRELQRAILTRQIVRSDVLLRGGGPWRDLGSIEELDPFFQASASKRPARDGSGVPVPPMNVPGVAHFPDGTSPRLATPPSADVPSALPEPGRNVAEGPPSTFPKRAAQWSPNSSARPFVARVPSQTHGQFGTDADGTSRRLTTPSSADEPSAPLERGQDVSARPKIETLRPPAGAAVAPPPPSTSSPPIGAPVPNATPAVVTGESSFRPRYGGEDVPSEFRPRYGGADGTSAEGGVVNRGDVPSAYAETSAAGEMVMRPPHEPTPAPFDPPVRGVAMLEPPRPPSAMFQGDELPEMSRRAPSFSTEEDWYGAPPRRRVGGWVVAFVLLLAVGVVGWAVAKPYVLARKAASIHEPDPRAQQFAADGERALSDGNLESAQEAFDKASALAESSPRVLLDEARVEAAKADIPWLKLRLLSPDSAEEMRATKQLLDDRLARVRKAAGDAVASAPADLSSARAAIDALRLEGATQEARSGVARIVSQSSQPETAYILAALDLAEPSPSWPTVIDRLRVAAAAEGNSGRARAALVYALARSGDPTDARAELAKLESLPRPYPLLPHLRGFVDRSSTKPVGSGASVAVNLASAGVRETAAQTRAAAQATAAGGGRVGRNAEPARGGDSAGGGMRAAARAIRAGDWDHARRIYEGLVERNPNDSEALSGIADVERAQGNVHGAIASYRQALSVNPSYLPALLGVADTEWGSGDRTNAQLTYKDIVERFPEGTYPSYVKTRAGAEGDRPASPSATVFSSVDAGASVDPDEP